MTLRVIVRNGVVVLDASANLPDGTRVAIVVDQAATASPRDDRLSEEELARRRAILDEIASLPDENPGDTFSGRDHDKVLYGPPYGA